MAVEVVMPRMGYDMTEATLVRWLKHEGESVARGEVIAEIETDKAIVEMQSPADGLLLKVLASEGATIPVGQVIAYVGGRGEVVSVEALPAREEATTGASTSAQVAAKPGTDTADDERTKVSPIARKLADERGLDLALVTGTGPGGRITRDDVLALAGRSPTPIPSPAVQRGIRAGFRPRVPGVDGTIRLGKMGQAIARRTQVTMAEAPHFYLSVQIDMTKASALRRELNVAGAPKARVSLNDVIIKACAMALQHHPVFNSTFEGDHLKVHPHVNVGVAVALPEGLIAPAILGCEDKSIAQIASDAKDLVERARGGVLRQDEYTGTFTVSNLGMFGVDAFTAIVVAPQVAVLAVGAVRPAPVVVGGEVVVRQMMTATLSTDHRAAHGAEAAQFAAEVKRLLEDPSQLES